jgi:hypothetical protein
VERRECDGAAARGTEKPEQHRHVVERVPQRPDDVGVGDSALGAGGLDRAAAILAARDGPDGVALRAKVARQVESAAAAADHEHPHAARVYAGKWNH